MTLWVILISFIVILSTGASIGVGLGLSSAIVLYCVLDMPLVVVVQRMFTSVDSFSFMAVPFFMLAGAFMSEGGVTKRIVDFSMAMVGALAGGLALVVAVAGMDGNELLDLLLDTGCASFQMKTRGPWMEAGDYKARFSIDIAAKDLRLGCAMAAAWGYKPKLFAQTLQYLQQGHEEGIGDEDVSALFKITK